MKKLKVYLQKILKIEYEDTRLQNEKQRTVGLIYLATFIIGIVGGSVMFFYDTNSSLSLFALGLVSFLGWQLNRAGHVNSSIAILIGTLIIVIQYNIFTGFGIHDVAIIAWPAFIFFAGLLFGSRSIPYVTTFVMLSAVATVVNLKTQLFSDYSDTGDLIVMLLILLAFSIIVRLILRINEQSIQQLKRSEARFQAIYHSINDAIVIQDSQTGAILDVNAKMLDMFGYTYSESIRLGSIFAISSGIPPYTRENAEEWICKAATLGAQHFEWQAKDKSGHLFWVDINMKLAAIANQTQILVSIRDVSERKQAEVALRASEGRYRDLFNYANLAIFQSGLKGEVLAVNQEFARMFGFASPSEVAATIHNASDLFVNPKRRDEIIQLRAEHPDLATFENLYRRKDGSTFLGKLNIRQAINPNNQLQFLEGFIEDITERKRVELQQEVLYQVLRVASSQLDADLVAHSAVETIVRLAGYPHVCIALPDESDTHWVVRAAAGSLAAELGATYLIHQGMIGQAFKTGQTQWVRDILDDPHFVRAVRAPNAPAMRSEYVISLRCGDRLLGALNIESDRVDAFDDTDAKMFQSLADMISLAMENARLYEEAQQEIVERKRAEVKIQAALEEKETLLREVHHRVKNNLQAMIALMEMQADLIPDESTRQFLKELEGQARTMSLVYEQLYQSINLARVQMDPYLQQLAFYISETFGGRRMVQLSIDAALISLDVAQAMPCGLIVNELFTNILKHAFPLGFPRQPMVHIALQFDGETYRLTVSDNGVGFIPRQDGHVNRSLGLHLVNMWATHQLGGTLNVSGDPGTTFTITFPKATRGS